ncbi:hypothetical protein NEDG_01873 [Nematocida displodere]|uniref:Translocation protein SEC66 n=1 Tax=Nematocida displodere TaxID=1805483 RepID=A0A177EJD5_9MICR|nr:hypothetical protein NEDG_01873 [Nematocida displodere]
MLQFVAIGVAISLGIVLYIRRGQIKKGYYISKYKNKYLEEYLEADPELPQADLYKILMQAAALLLEQEEELERESKWVNTLFYARMISSHTWHDLKTAKEELDFEKITVEGELGRFAKLAKTNELPSRQKKNLFYEIPAEDVSELKRNLYKKLVKGKLEEASDISPEAA